MEANLEELNKKMKYNKKFKREITEEQAIKEYNIKNCKKTKVMKINSSNNINSNLIWVIEK